MIKYNDSSNVNVASSCDNKGSGSISELQHLTIVLSISENCQDDMRQRQNTRPR